MTTTVKATSCSRYASSLTGVSRNHHRRPILTTLVCLWTIHVHPSALNAGLTNPIAPEPTLPTQPGLPTPTAGKGRSAHCWPRPPLTNALPGANRERSRSLELG
ncbi:hypothetical protein L209DRAFT_35833 [Thermothelomyces heterothallicus CBS 203.75]